MKTIKITFFLSLLSLILFSCDPVSVTPNDEEPDMAAAKAIVEAESNFDNVIQLVDFSLAALGPKKTSTFCADVSHDSTAKTITIDFGMGCQANNGVLRAGKIIIQYIGRYRQPGSTFSITFDAYQENGEQLDGSISISNFDRNADNQLFYTVAISNAKVTKANGETSGFDGSRTITWVAGEGTPLDPTDDQHEISGFAAGYNAQGQAYNLEIVEPLLYKIDCLVDGKRLPTAGSLTISSTEFTGQIDIDYGSGSCDNDATLFYNGNAYPFSI
ncbi:MAG: hypothetical protein AAGM67_02205 [Bacteroidota bacterium]